MNDHATSPHPADGIEPGKRLIRVEGDRGLSLAERIANRFYRLTWGTPLHAMRLRGKYPLKLLAVPDDRVPGDRRAGAAIRAGHFSVRGLKVDIESFDFGGTDAPAAVIDYVHSFAWLRDLAAAGTREQCAPLAEAIMRRWLEMHAEKANELAWRPDLAGWRIFFWTAYAPLILSSSDLIYRSLVLNTIARTARHLDRTADKAPIGLPRLVAWASLVAASLLIPGGNARRVVGEAGLKRAIDSGFHADGGTVSRSPLVQLECVSLFAMLRGVFDARREPVPDYLASIMARTVPALLGVTHGDGGLGSWQGAGPVAPDHIAAVIEATGVRSRPLRQARDWGYQRLAAGATVVLVDAAPPPVSRLAHAGCASTGAFELSDGPHRLIVNCGGAALSGATIPDALAQGLRTTAAHSTLVLSDLNSTALLPDGTLGKGVTEVALDRQETDNGSRLEISHDGYVRRLGFMHRRLLILGNEGRELRGEDMLLPAGRRRRAADVPFVLRFHLAPDVEPTLTADGLGALLRLELGALWQFRAGGGALTIDESLWVDANGRPHPSRQLVLSSTVQPGGSSVGWLLKRVG